MKVLIVEDDALLQTGICAALIAEGYACDSAYNAADAQSYPARFPNDHPGKFF